MCTLKFRNMGVGCSVEDTSAGHDDQVPRGSFAMRTGVNMHPCDICKTEKGVHYHSFHPTAKAHPNWENDRHMCPACKTSPGDLHVHDPQRLFFSP